MEIFKDIKGYEGKYQVSSLGRVKSLKRLSSTGKTVKEKILKENLDANGYFHVVLFNEGKGYTVKIHTLVAIEFLNHKIGSRKIVVDHIDSNKNNNKLDNLRIVTQRFNTVKDIKKGTSKYTGVNWDKARSKWRAQITINGKRKCIGLFNKEKDASEAYQRELSLIIKTSKDE